MAPVSRPSLITPAQTITAGNGMVVAQEQRAARIGIEILDRGGNAVDAAVAVGFALAVTYPRAGNIGGGGFMVIHLSQDGRRCRDRLSRNRAGGRDRENVSRCERRSPIRKNRATLRCPSACRALSLDLALAHEKYGSGKLSLAELIEPAITLARNGVEIVDDIADTLPLAQPRIARWQSSAPVFLNSDGTVLMPGQDLLQPDLAITLRAIASDGPKGFYEGPVAEKIVAAVRKAGGIMTTEDMKNYRAILREPIRGTYRGYDIISMPPPSSGGVHLIEMLNILEGYDLAKLSREELLHIIAEAMKRAYADRATFMGDPDAVKMPVAGLISKKYAAALRAQIGTRATPSTEIRSGNPADFEGQNTTHFSVIDRDGNAVSNTYTLNFSYGLGLVAEGTGVLLNNELDDFTSKPGTANAYGLVGYNANLPGPNRRPLSSMTPTILMKDGKPFLITGSPGGSRIISTVLQIIVNVIDFNLAIDQAVSAPRVHHQWQPDELYVEPGISPEILEGLVKRGYKVVPTPPQTSANSIEITADGYVGAADRRTRGSLAAGY